MRRILVDHARAKHRPARRPGIRVSLTDATSVTKDPDLDLVQLDEALNRWLKLISAE